MSLHICTKDKKVKKKKKQICKQERKALKFVTLSKMNNQKAHTEADKERGGQFIGKMSPPSLN